MKTSEGEVKMAVLRDNPGPEEYLQHLNSFLQMLSRKKWDDEMTKLTKAVQTITARVRKLARTLNEETEPQTSNRLSLWEAAEAELKKAEALESVKAGLVYDLFRKTLEEDPELQWSLGGFEGRQARRPPQEVGGIPMGMHRFPQTTLRRGKGFTCYVT